MKTITQWLDEYSESHQNSTNKSIHWVCVPAILFALIGILAHFSAFITAILLALSLVFYARLDIVLAVRCDLYGQRGNCGGTARLAADA